MRVTCADVKRTFFDLVGEEHLLPETLEHMRELKMAVTLFCVYLGLDIDLAAEGMPNSNHFIWGDYDLESVYDELDAGRLSSKAMAYITAASLKLA